MKTALAILFLAVGSLMAQERSDFEIVRSFDRQTKALSVAIDSAKTVQECADIQVTIDLLRKEYEPDKALLDRSLYGENFDQRIARITGQLLLAQGKLGVIESQLTRIVELETQVRQLSGEVSRLTGENAKLLTDVERLSGNIRNLSAADVASNALIDSLNGVIRKLRDGIRQRDQMIFALVDSLFSQYAKDIAQIGDTDQRRLVIKLDQNNVVSSVVTSIESNMAFLDRVDVKGSDLASMVKDQHRFASQWKGLGPKLASIYVSQKRRARELANIDTMLTRWSSKVDAAYWRGLNNLFQSRQMAVKPFANGAEFTSELSTYIGSQIPLESDTAWAAFEKVWNEELKPSWVPLMQERGDITAEQAAMIERRVEEWRSAVGPASTMIYALIFVVVVVVLAVVVVKMRERKPPAAQA